MQKYMERTHHTHRMVLLCRTRIVKLGRFIKSIKMICFPPFQKNRTDLLFSLYICSTSLRSRMRRLYTHRQPSGVWKNTIYYHQLWLSIECLDRPVYHIIQSSFKKYFYCPANKVSKCISRIHYNNIICNRPQQYSDAVFFSFKII